ncbi:dienelactone hydrolase family protein [Planctomycetota bacterium]|nr:dienelactone hydrolase family protein [Planctomycetota bacterium]
MRTMILALVAVVGGVFAGFALNSETAAQDAKKLEETKTDVQTKTVAYKVGELECEGFLAWDANVKGDRAGILLFPDWKGRRVLDENIAKEYAAKGYVVFSADMYGKDVRPKNDQEAGAAAGAFYGKDSDKFSVHTNAALKQLQGAENVDSGRICAIGFCFGGCAVIELARSGADIAGVVSFHGNLKRVNKADSDIKCKVLALHGADDPVVPQAEVSAFITEMQTAKTDWQLVQYGGAKHAFTNPELEGAGNDYVAYDKVVATRAWAAANQFFDEVLK